MTTATVTTLLQSAITNFGGALYNILVILIPVTIAVALFWFGYGWVRRTFF